MKRPECWCEPVPYMNCPECQTYGHIGENRCRVCNGAGVIKHDGKATPIVWVHENPIGLRNRPHNLTEK